MTWHAGAYKIGEYQLARRNGLTASGPGNIRREWMPYTRKRKRDVDLAPTQKKSESSVKQHYINTAPGLLSLPTEIRLMILDHALTTPKDEDLPMSYHPWRDQAMSRACVLQVCRQLNRESAPIHYGRNRFYLATPLKLYHFLSSLPRHHRNMIRRLSVSGWSNFSQDGWQLSKKAFSLLSFCANLRELHLTLHSNLAYDARSGDLMWQVVFGAPSGPIEASMVSSLVGAAGVLEENAQAATVLRTLRGLETIQVVYSHERDEWPLVPTVVPPPMIDYIPGKWGGEWLRNFKEDCRKPKHRGVETNTTLD